MNRSIFFAAAAVCAVALSGCDWGGAHENTWNDAYGWANFTGTYRFVNAIIVTSSSEADTDVGGGEGSSGTPGQGSTTTITRPGNFNAKMSSDSAAGGTVSPVGVGIEKGSFQARVGNNTISDDGKGGLLLKGKNIGSVDYASGGWNFSSASLNASAGANVAISYKYSTVNPTAGTPSETGASKKARQEGLNNAIAISYLNVTQQGNKITMSSDNGITYSGRITGTSMGKDGYVAAQTVYVSFEVASANGQTMVGNLSGSWSGSSDKNYGVLSNRQINGTHSRAGNFVGVAADVTIKVPDITVQE